MLPYLEITHTEPLSRRFCLIMQNILWNLFGIDVPNVMSDSVDEKKWTSETSCRRGRVNKSFYAGTGKLEGSNMWVYKTGP